VLCCMNQSAICIATNAQFHGRIKHIEIKYNFARELVMNCFVELKHCNTKKMLTDIPTKARPATQHVKFRKSLSFV